MSSKGQAWLAARSQPVAPADMPAASSGDAYGSSNSIGGVAVTPHPPGFPMPGFQPQWPCGPAGSLANMGITIPPRMQPPQLQLGNGNRMQMPQPQPPSQTAAIEMGVQFGFQMATLQHTCQQQAGALQQQADRLDLLEAQRMSEPTCDYHTDTLKQEGLLKQGGLLFLQITPITCRGLLHRSQCPSCVKLYDVWHIKPRWNPTGDTESSEPDGSNSAATSQPPTRKRPGATVFYTFTIGGVLLCVRMCHILILPYIHQGGMPPACPLGR